MAAPSAPGRRSGVPSPRWRRGLRVGLAALTVGTLGVTTAYVVAAQNGGDGARVATATYPDASAAARGAVVSRAGQRTATAAELRQVAAEPDPDSDAAAPAPAIQRGQEFHAYQQPGQEFALDPALLRRIEKVQEARRLAQTAIDFRIASFNVLGASHTDHGKARLHSGKRMGLTVGLIRDSGADVVGLQESQTGQARQFLGSMDGAWAAYPGPNGSSREVQNSIAWRTDSWTLVESHTLDIPYFHGKPMPMPYVLLQDNETKRNVWFMNVHNPADVRGPAQKWRNRAIDLETGVIRRLTADGTPFVITGDFNDRGDAFCAVNAKGAMHAALGGSMDGGCRPPGRMDVDWIFGSGTVQFSGYQRWDSATVDRASDHPLLFSDATVPGID